MLLQIKAIMNSHQQPNKYMLDHAHIENSSLNVCKFFAANMV